MTQSGRLLVQKTQSSPSCAVSDMVHIFYTELIVLKSLLPIYLGFTLHN